MLPKSFTECCHHKTSRKNYLQEKKFADKFLEDLYVDDSTVRVKMLEEGEIFS